MSARFLIIFPGALGDLICLTPTIAAIARRDPHATLELMARSELAEFAVGRLGITRAHSIDRREVALLFVEPSDDRVEEARRLFGGFQRIYCFFNSDSPVFRRALTAASAPAEISFHPFRSPTTGHTALAYLEAVTGRANLEQVAIELRAGDIEGAARAISGIAEPNKFIAIFPGSGSPAKNWPIEKFSKLADRLSDDTRVVFILGPAEISVAGILRAAGHTIIKDQPLGIVAAIARMASAFVGNDSGVSHLAAATGTEGFVLFGPSDPSRWRPLGRVTILRRDPIDSIEIAEVLITLATSGIRV